jgi:hypothetical protein
MVQTKQAHKFFAAIFAVLVLALFVPTSSAQEQNGMRMVEVQRVDGADIRIAVDSVRPRAQRRLANEITIPDDGLPSFAGVIQNVAAPNGSFGRYITCYTKVLTGTFLVKGNGASGVFDLGSFAFDENAPAGTVGYITIQKGDLARVLPTVYGGFFSIDFFRYDRGTIQKISASTGSFTSTEQGGPLFDFTREAVVDNQLFVTVSGQLDADAVAFIGNAAFADFKPSLFGGGGTAILPKNLAPFLGGTTVTVCVQGKCGTVPFTHRIPLLPTVPVVPVG